MNENLKIELKKIQKQEQRQDGTNHQLLDLRHFAIKLGMYDAADLIRIIINNSERK